MIVEPSSVSITAPEGRPERPIGTLPARGGRAAEYDDNPGYHAVFARDPDAFKIEVVHIP